MTSQPLLLYLWVAFNLIGKLEVISYLVSMGSLGSGPFSMFGFFYFFEKTIDVLFSNYLELDKFVLEEPDKLLIFQILFETFCSQLFSFSRRLKYCANAPLITIHEWDHGCENGANIPAWTPCFLVVMRKRSANRFAHLETPIIGNKFYFGGRERVVLWEFQYSMIEATLIWFLKPMEAKVKM